MRTLYLDIETPGLYPKPGDFIFSCAVLDSLGNKYKVYERKDILKLKPLLEDPNVLKVIHNAAFDCFWLWMVYGIKVVNIWDTQLCEQVIIGDNPLPDAPEFIMEQISAALFYTLKRYKIATIKTELTGDHFATRSRTAPLTSKELGYIKDDVIHLPKLRALQIAMLTKLKLMAVAELENKVVEVVVRMRVSGIGIDLKKWLQIENDNINKSLAIQKRLPPSVSNWNSPDQAKKYFRSIGIPVMSLEDITKEFQAKYNNDVLNKFVEMRKASTYASKYGKNFLSVKKNKKGKGEDRYLIDADGRIRASFFQVLNTGRFSCSAPPFHGLPRDGDHRSAIVPKKGYVFVSGDFSGQEIGIMAAASGEQLWIKALLRGEDPLSLMASIMFPGWAAGNKKGCAFPKKCKCPEHIILRQISKEVTYGIQYGAYPKSISIKINRTEKETRKLFYKHRSSARKLARWSEANAREAIKDRVSYSADVYRRRRTIRDPQEWMVRNVGYNNPVQSCAANMMKLAMISLNKKWEQVMTWHDDLILQVKSKDAHKAAKELKIIMEKAADYCTGIPGLIKVEPKILKSLNKK